jgi:plastocyanin
MCQRYEDERAIYDMLFKEPTAMNIKVGDTVTWRKAGRPGFEPLGVANCKVVAFGTTENGEPAATIEALGQEVNAYVKDLHPQSEQ